MTQKNSSIWGLECYISGQCKAYQVSFYTSGEGLHGKGAKCLQLAPPVPVMPHQLSPAGIQDAPTTTAQPPASQKLPVELANAYQQHWVEKIFSSVPHSANGLNHLRESALAIPPDYKLDITLLSFEAVSLLTFCSGQSVLGLLCPRMLSAYLLVPQSFSKCERIGACSE